MAQALGERELRGMRLAHPLLMPSDLPEEFRELIRHFADLPEDDRARILALVRSLSFCRTAELYSTSWREARFTRARNDGATPSDPGVLPEA
jgi:hypothetical protein